jgi:hypothetical protein
MEPTLREPTAYKDGFKPTSMMILGPDLNLFCKALSKAERICPGFAKLTKIVLY